MRPVLLLGPAAALVSAVALAAPLKLVAPTWPPYAGPTGEDRVAVELVETALKRAGIDATVVVRSEASVIEQVAPGEYAGSVAVWKSAARAERLAFSAPYLENRLVLLGRSGAEVDRPLAALKGKKVGLVTGYAYGDAVTEVAGPTFVRHENAAANLRALLEGEIDYMLADALLVHHLFQGQPERARELLTVGEKTVATRTLHLALRKNVPEARALLARFDAAVETMVKDGTFNRVLGVDWVRADVDGDGRAELVAGERAGEVAPARSYDIFTSRGLPGDDRVYVIDGVTYRGWDEVPDRYKKPVEHRMKQSKTGVVLMRF